MVSSALTLQHDGISTRTYYQLGRESVTIRLPISLSSPALSDELFSHVNDPAQAIFFRYCSNSGVAIGNSATEAIVHGALEAVERESISQLLIKVFLYRDRSISKFVEQSSLPEELASLIFEATHRIGSKVELVRVYGSYDFPVFCASVHDPQAVCQYAGFGASLYPEYAARRAISELIRGFDIANTFCPSAWSDKSNSIVANFKSYKLHLDCYQMRLIQALRELHAETVPFEYIRSKNTSLKVYLENIVERILAPGGQLFVSSVCELENQKVVHTFLAGQSYFFAAMEGSFVFPDLD